MHPLCRPNRRTTAYTLMELTIVLILITAVLGIAIPNVLDYNLRSKGAACASNLRAIEIAKNDWLHTYPHTPLIPSVQQLETHLKSRLPSCPFGGTYNNVLDCTRKTTCSFNGNSRYEPNEPPLDANGYNDLTQ